MDKKFEMSDDFIGTIKDCVGCGFCCLKAKCAAAARLYPAAEVCPQLIWDEEGGRYNCGLMQLPGNVGFEFRQELYAGEGCCSNLNTWRKDVKNRTAVDKEGKWLTIDPMFQIFLSCLGREWISGDVLTLLVSGFVLKLVNHMDMTEEDAVKVGNLAIQYIKNDQPSYVKEFMG